MPSSARYAELKAVLRSTTKAFDNAKTDEDRLVAGLGALQAVIHYLHGDKEVLDNFLTKPLADIENAVHDAGKGAFPPLLDHKPQPASAASDEIMTLRVLSNHKGRRVRTIQAMMVVAVDLLIAAQVGKGAALRRVADAARVFGIRSLDGAVITAKQIENWRSEIKKPRGPDSARKMYTDLARLPQHVEILSGPHEAAKRQHAELRARAILKTIASIMPRSAPKQQRRAER